MPLRLVPTRDRALHRLVRKGRARILHRGELLFGAGETASELFLVRSGYLRRTAPAPRGDERTLSVAGPWELAGEEGMISGARRWSGARAGAPSEVTVLEGAAAARALRNAARTWEAYLLAKEEEIAFAGILGALQRPGGASRRLAALLLHLRRRSGLGGEGGEGRLLPLTHQQMADLSRCHRSTVTTFLNEWIYQGILREGEGGILVARPRDLEGAAALEAISR